MRRQPEPEQWAAAALLGLVCVGLSLVGCAGEPNAAGPRPTLLVFTSPACYGCVQDYPVVQKIADMGLATVNIITAEQSPDELEQWGVDGLPTYILVLDGRELYRTHQAELARRRILRLYR